MGYKDTSSQFGRLNGMELRSGGIDLEKKKIVLTKLSRRTKVLAYGVIDFLFVSLLHSGLKSQKKKQFVQAALFASKAKNQRLFEI